MTMRDLEGGGFGTCRSGFSRDALGRRFQTSASRLKPLPQQRQQKHAFGAGGDA